jgi:small-conductance mechanosensitive channel
VLFLFVVRRVGRRIRGTLQNVLRNRSVKIHSIELMRAEGAGSFVDGVVHLAGVLLGLVSVFFYCDYVLSLFPWTRAVAANMLGYVLGPLGSMGTALVNYVPSLLFLAVLALVTRFVLSVLRLVTSRLSHGPDILSGFHPEWAWPTYRLVRIVVIVFAAVVAFPYIPFSDSDAFKGISIFVGVLLSLGSSSLIGNLIAGYTLIYWRALSVGDRVQIGDVAGVVSETGILVTRVRTPKNEDVVIPNTTILSGKIVNYSSLAKDPGLILHTTVGIGYQTPWRQVEAMLLAAAERTPGVLQNPKPFVLQRALGDFAVTYEINVYTDDPHVMLRTYHALHRSILDVFNEFGVQIMVPAYEGDPADPKVVPKERWHEAPATPPSASKDPTKLP